MANTPSSEKTTATISQQLEQANALITATELNNDLEKRLSVYNQNSICMPDHQASMQGITNLKLYHSSIFDRQNLSKYQRKTTKIIPVENRIIELGTYEKEGTSSLNQTPFLHKGKYFNVWTFDESGILKLAIETWNYDQAIEDINSILVRMPPAKQHGIFEIQKELSPQQSKQLSDLSTIMKNGVKKRDGTLRTTIYHDDAIFMPHDEPMMIGKKQILEHLIAYNSGNVSIDSIEAGSNWAENLGDYILQSSNYYVEWSVDSYSGIGKGKGLRLWRKTKEGNQKMLINIALRDSDPKNKNENEN